MNLQDAIPFLENNHNGVVGDKTSGRRYSLKHRSFRSIPEQGRFRICISKIPEDQKFET